MTSPEQAMAARLQAEAAERNTPRANLLLAIKSLAAKAEAHPKVWGPAALKAAQLEAISTFERAVTADLQQSLAAATTERERLARINEMLHERLDRNVPCSDHRDKISPGVCPICEAEERTVARLKASKQGIAWNQGYSAAEAKYVAQRDAAYTRRCGSMGGTSDAVTTESMALKAFSMYVPAASMPRSSPCRPNNRLHRCRTVRIHFGHLEVEPDGQAKGSGSAHRESREVREVGGCFAVLTSSL